MLGTLWRIMRFQFELGFLCVYIRFVHAIFKKKKLGPLVPIQAKNITKDNSDSNSHHTKKEDVIGSSSYSCYPDMHKISNEVSSQ